MTSRPRRVAPGGQLLYVRRVPQTMQNAVPGSMSLWHFGFGHFSDATGMRLTGATAGS